MTCYCGGLAVLTTATALNVNVHSACHFLLYHIATLLPPTLKRDTLSFNMALDFLLTLLLAAGLMVVLMVVSVGVTMPFHGALGESS